MPARKNTNKKRSRETSETSDFPFCMEKCMRLFVLKSNFPQKHFENKTKLTIIRFIVISPFVSPGLFMTLLWKRRDYLLSSWFTITFPFLPKQQRKYWLRRLPANFIWQILSHFLCVYTNYHNDAFEGLFLSSTWNSWTHPNGHPVLPTFWSLWI